MGNSKKYSSIRLFLVLLFCFACGGSFYLWSEAETEITVTWLYPHTYYEGHDFTEGRAWIREHEDGSWALLDDMGNILRKNFEAKNIYPYKNGFARFVPLDNRSLLGFLDRSGDVVVSPDHYGIVDGEYGEGLISKQGDNGLHGFVDLNGKWKIPPIYDGVSAFREGLAGVRKNKKYGFINTAGDVVIDLKFDAASWFSHKMAIVKVGAKFGVINPEGRWVAEPIYEHAYVPWGNPIGLEKNGRVGFIDSNGKEVIGFKFLPPDARYGKFQTYCFNEGRASVAIASLDKAKHEYWFIDLAGKLLFKIGDHPSYFKGNLTVDTKTDGSIFLIDKDGHEFFLPPNFKYPPVIVVPTEDNIFTARDEKNHKVGYFTINR